jgi:tryptophan synthase alpha subunit
MTRIEKVREIIEIAKERELNITTILGYLAVISDKGVTKFHKEIKEKVV